MKKEFVLYTGELGMIEFNKSNERGFFLKLLYSESAKSCKITDSERETINNMLLSDDQRNVDLAIEIIKVHAGLSKIEINNNI